MIEKTVIGPEGIALRTLVAGSGPSVLLANGLGGTEQAWSPVVDRFSDRFRFITWDYRGLYGSGRPHNDHAYTIEDHVADAVAVLAAHRGQKAIVMGWSMGVQVALALALAHPEKVRALVLFNGVAGRPMTAIGRGVVPGSVPAMLTRLLLPFAPIAGAIAARVAPSPVFVDLATLSGLAARSLDRDLFQAVSAQWGGLDYDAFFRILLALEDHDATPHLGRVSVPTLVIQGEHDALTPASAGAFDALPDGQIRIVPGSTHYTILERPETANLHLARFLKPFEGQNRKSRTAS